jgi:hypothetical protein
MLRITKWAIWLYILLLIFEGALRKWVFPGLANPLLLVRDPVLLLIYAFALGSGVIPRSRFLMVLAGLLVASVVFSFLAGQYNFWVILYGLRCNYLHVPLIWIIAEVMNREDVERIGVFFLFMAILMTAVMVLQFKSSNGAWINRGVGGDENSQIYGAAGHNRPPGLFSFITGPMVFLPMAAAFFLHAVTLKRSGTWQHLLNIASGLAIAIALPISISRGAMIGTLLVVLTFIFCVFKMGSLGKSFIRYGIIGLVLIAGISFAPIFDEGREAFMSRWDQAASEVEGKAASSLVIRVMSAFYSPLETIEQAPIFGYGIGVGSNVGSQLLTGARGFALAEAEWDKAIIDLGPMLGLCFILFRIVLVFSLGKVSWQALTQNRDPLPMLILSAAGIVILFNQWGQPTQLGFAVVGGGLLLASVNRDEEEEDEDDDEENEEEDASEAEEEEPERPATEHEARRRRMRGQ